MIMRIGFSRVTVYMSADAEAQVGILVDDLPIRCIVIDISGNELVVLECLLDEMADPLASRRAGILFENFLNVSRERFERKTHDEAPFTIVL